MNFFKQLYLPNRFFYLFGGIIILFALSYGIPLLFPLALTTLLVSIATVLVDTLLLFHPEVKLNIQRQLPKIFSLSDDNTVRIALQNLASRSLSLTIIDELPLQFQARGFLKKLTLQAGQEKTIRYEVRPIVRGEYEFGAINVFAETNLGLLKRRYRQEATMSVPVYPSILQMKQYAIMAFDAVTTQKGIKKIRRIGHSYEFEQIKNYVKGDDYRSINWKATSRQNQLMVNQYEDERAQQVYNIIDKSRVMKMPFEGLSLMDYAINTSLVLSNIALQKNDKAGLITFSDKIGTTLKAEQKNNQLNKILHALYKEKERNLEANYQLLYQVARRLITGRSLIMLYTNFESMFALDRTLPILRRINNLHLLVVVFFENTEISDFVQQKVDTVAGIYTQTVAQNYLAEKTAMVQKLRQYGIQAVLTPPNELSINTINKYLELKSRGLI